MNRSKFLLALAGLTLAMQVVSVDANAQSARHKCRNRSSRTVGGAGIGAIFGGVVGAIAGDGKGAAIGAGFGAVGGAVVRDAEGADACRKVDMDRMDREDARREEARRRDEEARRGGGRYGRDTFVLPKYTFEQDFLRYYAQRFNDEERLNEVAEYADVLANRREMIDGESLYQILVRIDGGRDQRLTANRAEALRRLAPVVAGLNYDQRSWVEGLFPNKGHRLYPEVASIIRSLSY